MLIVISIILLILIHFILIYYIMSMNKAITELKQSESNNCPSYYCDNIINPSTGEIESGTLCDNMVAYRYINESDGTFECQSYPISNNVIM